MVIIVKSTVLCFPFWVSLQWQGPVLPRDKRVLGECGRGWVENYVFLRRTEGEQGGCFWRGRVSSLEISVTSSLCPAVCGRCCMTGASHRGVCLRTRNTVFVHRRAAGRPPCQMACRGRCWCGCRGRSCSLPGNQPRVKRCLVLSTVFEDGSESKNCGCKRSFLPLLTQHEEAVQRAAARRSLFVTSEHTDPNTLHSGVGIV